MNPNSMSFSGSTLDGLLRDLSELHERKSELEAELTQVNDLIEEVSEQIMVLEDPPLKGNLELT